jgi:uncharacterized membrane protein YvbJ
METFITTFSFTFGILAALACIPVLFIFVMVILPNLLMAAVTRLSSKEHKVKKWTQAVEAGDESAMKFMRKWGWDKAGVA